MPDHNDALTRLVQEHVGDGRALTIRAFAAQAIDPDTGTGLSKSTVGNLVQGHSIKVNPIVLRAIAAGLGVSEAVVQVAAMAQYIGVVVDDPFDTPPGDDDAVVRVAHDPNRAADDMPTVKAFVERARTAE
ncbi:hypothetical protein ABZ456_29280 [Streptomyces sp. NPDC005776]|uniref:hypothetical protein n=1 Tax=Streptomyces sp. NPDC005776 TaxID=3154676 RepID=UPI0033C53C3C